MMTLSLFGTLGLSNTLPMGTLAFPTAGAYLAALLVAMLVGSGLGILRALTTPQRKVPAEQPAVTTVETHDHPHRVAA